MRSTPIPAIPTVADCDWRELARRLRLSTRQTQIALLILEDEKELAIATRLRISEHTVHTHLERLYQKLGVSSRVRLVACLFHSLLQLAGSPGSPIAPVCPRYRSGRCPFRSRQPDCRLSQPRGADTL